MRPSPPEAPEAFTPTFALLAGAALALVGLVWLEVEERWTPWLWAWPGLWVALTGWAAAADRRARRAWPAASPESPRLAAGVVGGRGWARRLGRLDGTLVLLWGLTAVAWPVSRWLTDPFAPWRPFWPLLVTVLAVGAALDTLADRPRRPRLDWRGWGLRLLGGAWAVVVAIGLGWLLLASGLLLAGVLLLNLGGVVVLVVASGRLLRRRLGR